MKIKTWLVGKDGLSMLIQKRRGNKFKLNHRYSKFIIMVIECKPSTITSMRTTGCLIKFIHRKSTFFLRIVFQINRI